MSWIPIASASWLCLASLSARWGTTAAENRGRPGVLGFLLGLFLGPPGYLIAERLPRDAESEGLWDAPQGFEADMLRTRMMSEFERACYDRPHNNPPAALDPGPIPRLPGRRRPVRLQRKDS